MELMRRSSGAHEEVRCNKVADAVVGDSKQMIEKMKLEVWRMRVGARLAECQQGLVGRLGLLGRLALGSSLLQPL